MTKVLLTGLVLIALWAVSFGLSYVDLGQASLLVALGVAAVKAAIVVWIFMELGQERTSVRLSAASAVLMVVILVVLVTADVVTRARPPLRAPSSHVTSPSPGQGAPRW